MNNSDRTYPALPEGLALKLRAIEQLMEFDPGYLASDACPYPEDLRVFVRRLVTPVKTGRPDLTETVFTTDMDETQEVDSLIGEIKQAINSMKRLQRAIDESDDVSDRLNFLKNYGSMMDRFLALIEKANGVKQMYEFQRIVIQTLEQSLDKDQRLEFKERLKLANLATV